MPKQVFTPEVAAIRQKWIDDEGRCQALNRRGTQCENCSRSMGNEVCNDDMFYTVRFVQGRTDRCREHIDNAEDQQSEVFELLKKAVVTRLRRIYKNHPLVRKVTSASQFRYPYECKITVELVDSYLEGGRDNVYKVPLLLTYYSEEILGVGYTAKTFPHPEETIELADPQFDPERWVVGIMKPRVRQAMLMLVRKHPRWLPILKSALAEKT